MTFESPEAVNATATATATDVPRRAGADGAVRAPAAHGVRTLTSGELFALHGEVQIVHNGALYRLKQTALGKLILTK